LPLDVLLTGAIVFLQVVGTLAYASDEPPSPWSFDRFAAVLLAAGPLALLVRRRWPEAALVLTFVAAAGYVATGYPRGPGGFPAFVLALVTAIMLGRRRFAWGMLVVAYVAFAALPYVNPDEVESARGVAGSVANLAWLPLVVAASEIVRVRLERQAERTQAAREEARLRASEERMLIARELHDVLAHTISLINVQSGVALHLLDQRPEQARPALEAINEASDEALGELRSALDVLSRGGEGGANGGNGDAGETGSWAPRSPTAGVAELDGLVRRTRAAGLDVRLAVEGEERPLPAGVDLAAFRIAQEALTNVVRHAGPDARATVRLAYAPDELVVQVDDDGRGAGPAPDGPGRGIPGMRERVHALDGTFAAGPRPGRGFRVRARFPLQDEGR
jgi:signal transduction histidine kinase